MSFELQDVVNDPDLAEPFIIERSSGGQFVSGGWSEDTTEISVFGVVTVATEKQLESLPEADRVHGIRAFFLQCPIYVTSEERGGTSDILVWNGVNYRVLQVAQFQNRGGFYCALAARMTGN